MSDGVKLVICGRQLGIKPGWKCIHWRGGACADSEYCVFQVEKPTESDEVKVAVCCMVPSSTCNSHGVKLAGTASRVCLRMAACKHKAMCPVELSGVKKGHPTCRECKYWHEYWRSNVTEPSCCFQPGAVIWRSGDRAQCHRGATKV